ncbi:hypothetical protein HMPREF9554_00281 [Treponema phagedenis F0421]|nr:hypothetical protein HMPREF9554_00281 [Treponema phagedenis F0421]
MTTGSKLTIGQSVNNLLRFCQRVLKLCKLPCFKTSFGIEQR